MMAYRYDRRGAKPKPSGQADSEKWDHGGKQKFVRWMEGKFLPAFSAVLREAKDSVAGELFGEGVFDAFLKTQVNSPELLNKSQFFGYPQAGTRDDQLMSMLGQHLADLRFRHPAQRRVQTPTRTYERDFEVISGIVKTLKG